MVGTLKMAVQGKAELAEGQDEDLESMCNLLNFVGETLIDIAEQIEPPELLEPEVSTHG
jgi:hypothetical protein